MYLPEKQVQKPVDEATHKGPLPILYITPEPQMPELKIDVMLPYGVFLNGELTYEAKVTYRDHGRNDESETITGTSEKLSFEIDFGEEIQGGKLSCRVNIPVKSSDKGEYALQKHYVCEIRGINPDFLTIRKALEELEREGEIMLQVLGYIESTFAQFKDKTNTPLKEKETFGLPIFKTIHGFGIMQLDPPSSKKQIWDWRENIRGGKERLDAKRREAAESYGKLPAVAIEKLTDEMRKADLYQRYNTGRFWRWCSDAEPPQWKNLINRGSKNKSSCKEQEKLTGEDFNHHARKCMSIEAQVRKGEPVPRWIN